MAGWLDGSADLLQRERQLLPEPLLEAHLLLWLAKYRIWIPDHPEHALVYMADEEKLGTAFPYGIEGKIRALLRGERWFLD